MNLQLLWWTSDKREITVGGRSAESMRFARRNGMCVVTDQSFSPYITIRVTTGRASLCAEGQGRPNSRLRTWPPRESGHLRHTHQGFARTPPGPEDWVGPCIGFSVAYSETHELLFLATAQRIADYAIKNLPNDSVPWYDFDDEGVHFRNGILRQPRLSREGYCVSP